MILIADSGSTKTDWRLMDGSHEISQIKTKGFNPYYQEMDEMIQEIESALMPALDSFPISTIFFYGAGCSTIERQKKISNALAPYFKETEIIVQSDLIGAARALSGNQPGIVCILGTGSGSCQYDGINIIKNIPSLGFVLGDEGSGAWLGKKMVTDYLRGHMPKKCIETINQKLHIDKEIILEHVNHKPMPSRYLAGFAKFISENIDQTYFYQLMFDSFTSFAKNYIIRYSNYTELKCHFVGSVAFHNQEILEHVAKYTGFRIGNIIKSPIDGLTLYHSTKS
ncbi:MAG: N-acetylglucosamine kinase, partial [Cyclobacteriaceae bacterium]|nr:N-acetylglucosamine kinase [Cyclobacteriaceae bacterium]